MAAGPEAMDRTIPGTRKLSRLEENLGSVEVELTSEDLRKIEEAISSTKVEGKRYDEVGLKMVNL